MGRGKSSKTIRVKFNEIARAEQRANVCPFNVHCLCSFGPNSIDVIIVENAQRKKIGKYHTHEVVYRTLKTFHSTPFSARRPQAPPYLKRWRSRAYNLWSSPMYIARSVRDRKIFSLIFSTHFQRTYISIFENKKKTKIQRFTDKRKPFNYFSVYARRINQRNAILTKRDGFLDPLLENHHFIVPLYFDIGFS